ncbi:hypothetical protein [Emticicia sp. SJ17W-69]
MIDTQSGEPVNGTELKTYHFVETGVTPLLPGRTVKLKCNSNHSYIPA